MFNQKAQAIANSVEELRESSKEFIKATKAGNPKNMENFSQSGIIALSALVTNLLSFRDECGESVKQKFRESAPFQYYKIKNTDIDNIRRSLLSEKSQAMSETHPTPPKFDRLLNMIKHCKAVQSTFEITEKSEHRLILTGDKFQNQPAYVIIFDVENFCNCCWDFVNEAQNFYR